MPFNFDQIFADELKAIAARRSGHSSPPTPRQVASNRPQTPRQVASSLFGICFSGGGIRSATLNLGVLQGLAALNLLRLADYLSTVSGGGYIGSWFQALCKASGAKGIWRVQNFLENEVHYPGRAAADPITFLRKYSNYLAPRLGLLSADTWVIFTIWLRNTVLNQLILFFSLAGLFLLPLVLGNIIGMPQLDWSHVPLLWSWMEQILDAFWPWAIATVIGLLLLAAVWRISANLRPITAREFGQVATPLAMLPLRYDDDGKVWRWIVAPVFIGAFALCCLTFSVNFDPLHDAKTFLAATGSLLFLFAISLLTGGFWQCSAVRWQYRSASLKRAAQAGLGLVIVVACTLTSGGLLLAVRYIVWPASPETVWDCLTFGPPLVIFALTCGVTLQIGLMGVDFADSAREWYSRVAAKLLVLNLIWLGAFILVAFTPIYVLWLFQNHLAIGGSGVVAWLLTTFAGFQAGKSPSTGGTPPANTATLPAQNVVVDAIARVAPPIAVAVLLVAISTLSFEVIDKVWPMPQPVSTAVTQSQATAPGLWDVLLHPPREHRALQLAPKQVGLVAIGAGILFALAWMLSARFNINEFSMNHFYKNRLVRCYLGASKGANRRANPFTGFDPKDDIPLQDLAPGPNHDAPYPILNCTLNLNAGSELAWQERKATSFIFTPLYCGYKPEHPDSHGRGYVPTSQFLQNGGPHIGLATAISGAAANPNWGYHTSPVTAFLMTIFNVRLGWWVGNTSHTRHPTWKTPGPSIALKYLFYEMIGLTDETCRYLNLSDGGHFENLGLYELIRRKCRFIIASDGEQDEEYVFESLGGAIRKARIDFGAEIDLLPKRIVIKDGGSAVHCALGTITYNNGATGQLLYIKSSLTGDEPYDVTQYQKAHKAFPQESTLDQFFTESQFESYRALGRHIVEKIFEQAGLPPKDLIQLEETFDRLAQIWLPPASAAAGAFTKHAQAYSQFLQRLGKDKDLRFLDAELLPGSSPARRPDKDSEAMRKAKLLVTDLIQLMEDVYVDLNLDDPAQADHPQNRGWIILFTHWTKPGTLLSGLWQQLGTTYGVGFRRFYDKLPNI